MKYKVNRDYGIDRGGVHMPLGFEFEADPAEPEIMRLEVYGQIVSIESGASAPDTTATKRKFGRPSVSE